MNIKQVGVVSGLISILFGIVSMSYSANVEAKKRAFLRCSYDHAIKNENGDVRVITVVTADVVLRSLCPAIPEDVSLLIDGEAAMLAHKSTMLGNLEPVSPEQPDDIECIHNANILTTP